MKNFVFLLNKKTEVKRGEFLTSVLVTKQPIQLVHTTRVLRLHCMQPCGETHSMNAYFSEKNAQFLIFKVSFLKNIHQIFHFMSFTTGH